MEITPSISAFLARLDEFSRHKLTRRNDLEVLFELARRQGREDDVDRLSFQGKFIVRAFGIMNRIGLNGEGYEKLSDEFRERLAESRALLESLTGTAPDSIRASFAAMYLAMTSDGLQNLLALLYDLSWYKNWRIDHPGDAAWQATPA